MIFQTLVGAVVSTCSYLHTLGTFETLGLSMMKMPGSFDQLCEADICNLGTVFDDEVSPPNLVSACSGFDGSNHSLLQVSSNEL